MAVKQFIKGTTAYVVEKASHVKLNGGRQENWRSCEVKVKSSGSKFVTVEGVEGAGAPRRFRVTDKPALIAEKGGAYLVNTRERAGTLVSRLEQAG